MERKARERQGGERAARIAAKEAELAALEAELAAREAAGREA
jgi:hypothetical protein